MVDHQPSSYRQTRCRHGWVDQSQCEQCKEVKELRAEIERQKAVIDGMTLVVYRNDDGKLWAREAQIAQKQNGLRHYEP